MKAVRHHVHGRIEQQNDQQVLWLLNGEPKEKTAVSLYLRYAFVTLGREDHIFPGLILDDWGAEIKGMAIYRWVKKFGSQFPRGEIFGFKRSGEKVQIFVRELELYRRLPCYVYPTPSQPLPTGLCLAAIVQPSTAVTAPKKIKAPRHLPRAMRSAAVSWWQMPATVEQFDFSLLG